MAYPKFHGIQLAKNSSIENLHVESLAADPLLLAPGRIWFNSTEKKVKFSTRDAGGVLVVQTVSDSASTQAAIAALQSALDAEVASRGTDVTAEVDARIAAVAALQASLTAEVDARVAAVAAEAQARIDGDATEAAARVAADAVTAATAADQLATETAARLAGDAALGGRIDDVQAELNASQAGAGLDVDGGYTAPENTTYLENATSLKNADVLLDAAITAEAAARVGVAAALASALANEAQARADGDANLQSQLQAWVQNGLDANAGVDAAETAARIAAVSALQAEIDRTQATIGTDADGNLIPISGTNYLNDVTTVFGGAFVLDTQIKLAHDAIVAEGLARATADTNFQTSLTAEATARAAADDAQQQELNATQAGAGLETDGSFAAPTGSNYLNASTSLKDSDYILDAALRAAEDKVDVVINTTVPALQAATAAEATRAQAAEQAEATARAAADTVLTDAVAAEVARATAAEAAVAANLAAEVARAQAAEGSLQTQVTAIVAASGEGAAALKTSLNAGRFTFVAPAAALEHVIQHNLNSEFVLSNIMVEGEDGVYRNDIVPVEEVEGDALNSFRVSLTEARKIKVSVMNMSALG